MTYITFKGEKIVLAGNFLKKGERAPPFCLVDETLHETNLKNIPGNKILSIVPSIDTEVCLTSTIKFNAEVANNPKLTVLVISADLPFAHKRVCGRHGIDNIKTLSTMRNETFAKDYGVLINSGPLKGLCARAVIVLDKDNTVIHAELVSELSHEPDYQAALNACGS